MVTKIPALGAIYIESCRRYGVAPNSGFLSSLFKADVKRSHHEVCIMEVLLDHVKDIDFHPLLEVTTRISESEIEAVDVLNESSCALNGEYALLLMRSIGQKLRIVDLQDLSFGKDFLRDLSQRGLQCQVLNLRSSHFRKLNLVGEFMWLHSLNLDYSTTLSSFREDCFSCMPNLMCLSMCETRVSNLWTTIAALSKLHSLVELRFQNWLCCNDVGSSGSSSGDDQPGPSSQPNNVSFPGMPPVSLDILIDLDVVTENAIRNLLPFSMNQNFQSTNEESSDDSEIDFSIHLENSHMYASSNAPPGWNRESNLLTEVSSSALSNQNGVESSEGASSSGHVADASFKYISEHASPICCEKHYREYMIASIPQLKVLDNLPIRNIDREMANRTYFKHFESLPYRRYDKENVVSILQKRETRAKHSNLRIRKQMPLDPAGKSPYFYTRSLCAAKMGSSAWPCLHSLSITSSGLGDENRSFRPRQFEYHPTNSGLMVFGTLDGEVVIVNHEKQKIVSYIPSLGAMNSVLGLCWLKKYPSRLIAGSDNGSLKLYDIQHFPSTSNIMHAGYGSVTFDEFDQLTSVHVNSTDELFLASGYSKNVALYDINSGIRLQVFTNMHQEHINVVKFSNHSPTVFATSSFDRDVKMWDLRQNPSRPCYTASSSKGNVMVCFSPDDHCLLVSAVDNEVTQLLAADGRLHLDFNIPTTGSSLNYTRSYYLNGKDYIISGSCDEHVVRVCCAQTGRRLRDISLEGKAPGSSMFVQSLRGDPFRAFNMSILAAYTRPSSKSEIVKVNLLASSVCNKESSPGGSTFLFNSMGG
ncbi:hypothetical protein F3Y22_tig00111834pilonHSYRG00174 [Hibiscus syriacus]|uniref:U2A'/phosphoprotein 32 family A C-terminal domain-containing protein n=1 Tax=Hibiscus syriacus TaxID=106335 RepID=A0A6A2XBZ7_HIBSY|nr:uncharacterized protein LOC120171513 [Hibiscus syriacus]KAE8672812.1 hypothetical protein F3Y22_tig00111834pilonHSYRG00174 [Hibiscus syriacus]